MGVKIVLWFINCPPIFSFSFFLGERVGNPIFGQERI